MGTKSAKKQAFLRETGKEENCNKFVYCSGM